ncbi:MarR family transcriptional regulator [Candidatus Thorarchaeota archaeon]|nr:MAG: MarR family transcriptional regulator [Candidatus Thorarchaeota archaeon]
MILDLPKSALRVLDSLSRAGPMSPKDISEQADLAPRTVSFALRRLLGKKLLKKVPNFEDMRQPLYIVNTEMIRDAFSERNASPLIRMLTIMDWKKTA